MQTDWASQNETWSSHCVANGKLDHDTLTQAYLLNLPLSLALLGTIYCTELHLAFTHPNTMTYML